jgi:hypothetical protein
MIAEREYLLPLAEDNPVDAPIFVERPLPKVRRFCRFLTPNQDEYQNTCGNHHYAAEPNQFDRHRCLLTLVLFQNR